MDRRRTRALLAAVLVMAASGWIGSATRVEAYAGRSPANCGHADRREPALQGQVPVIERLNSEAADGYWCNLELVGAFPSRAFGNFDAYEHCAYYTDNAGFEDETGAIVLDVSNPRHPVQTAYLTARAMGNAGETLRVNQERGLLVAAHYNPSGLDPDEIHRTIAVYDVSKDCARPRLLADALMPSAAGHEGCFQPDGMVYYMASGWTITPIDLSDPSSPRQLSDPWPLRIHGCSISDDGTRGYFSIITGEMLIVDTSQVQRRVPGAQPKVLASFPTPDVQFQQSSVPVSYDGHPYVLQWSEGKTPAKLCEPGRANFGYARLVDVADHENPVELPGSKIQTAVMKPEYCERVMSDLTLQTRNIENGDPYYAMVSIGVLGYDTHMCTPDRLHDPSIVACAQLGSGLRVYDVRDPQNPSEIAYYNTGTVSRSDPTVDWAFARPVIRSDLGQIWWTTNHGGFHVAKFRDGVWPFPDHDPCPSTYDYYLDQYDQTYPECPEEDAP